MSTFASTPGLLAQAETTAPRRAEPQDSDVFFAAVFQSAPDALIISRLSDSAIVAVN